MEAILIILWTLVNVLPLSNAITCSEIGQCEYDSQTYANAQNDGDTVTLCNLLGKSLECTETAMEDCEKRSNFPQNRLREAQQVVEMHKKQVLDFCPRSENYRTKTSDSDRSKAGSSKKLPNLADIPNKPTCTDIMTCMFDLEQFKEALKDNRLTEACSLINPSVKCLRLAIKDCKDNQFIDNEDIVNATHSLTDAEKLLQSYCGYTREKEETKTKTNPEISEKKNLTSRLKTKPNLEQNFRNNLLKAQLNKQMLIAVIKHSIRITNMMSVVMVAVLAEMDKIVTRMDPQFKNCP